MVCALINNLLTEKEMMEAGTLAIKNTLMYSSEVKEWLLEESTTEQSMESWKAFWEKKIRIANMAVAKDASTMGYGINNMEEDTASEERFLETAGQFTENAAKRDEGMVNMIKGTKDWHNYAPNSRKQLMPCKINSTSLRINPNQ